MQAANIPLIRHYKTLPFAVAVVNGAQLMAPVNMPEVASGASLFISGANRPYPSFPARHPAETSRISKRCSAHRFEATVASIDIPNAWAAGYTGQGTTIAVLDGGFNINHPMLVGQERGRRLLRRYWRRADGGMSLGAADADRPRRGVQLSSGC